MAKGDKGVTVRAYTPTQEAAKRLVALVEREGWQALGVPESTERPSITAVLFVAVAALERNVTAKRQLAEALSKSQ